MCPESSGGILSNIFFQHDTDIDYSDLRYRGIFSPRNDPHSLGGGARGLQSIRIVGAGSVVPCFVIYTLDFGMI